MEAKTMYEDKISKRSLATPPSLIRSILKATEQEDVISFAGGLPNPISFPSDALKESSTRIIDTFGPKVFQYSTTAGLEGLRQYIAERLNTKYNMNIVKDEIIITTGSQQALDLIGKILINQGDDIIIEKPGYLGAIQAFSQYQPEFHAITLENDGMAVEELETELKKSNAKFMYLVPNYQNPTGIIYSDEKRKVILDLVHKYNCILVEDDPYGELCFEGSPKGYISAPDPSGSILFGTFSKTVTPGMRLGYMVIRSEALRKRINTAKEAADLHSNIFSQYMIWDYVTHNDIEEHIARIRELYKNQCGAMIRCMEKFFPENVTFTRPTGGMFLWVTLPEEQSTMELFTRSSKENVVFVPGNPFYSDGKDINSMRFNYTNSSETMIEEGIKRIASLM